MIPTAAAWGAQARLLRVAAAALAPGFADAGCDAGFLRAALPAAFRGVDPGAALAFCAGGFVGALPFVAAPPSLAGLLRLPALGALAFGADLTETAAFAFPGACSPKVAVRLPTLSDAVLAG